MAEKSQTATADRYAEKREKDRQIRALQQRLRSLSMDRASSISRGDTAWEEQYDAWIAEVQAELRALRGGVTPAEQQVELETKIAAAEAELRQLTARKPAAVEAKLKKEHGAVARLRQIEKEIATAEDGLRTLRQQHAELRQRIADDSDAARRHAAETTPRRLAELARERQDLSEKATAAAHTLAASLRAIERNGEEMADLLDAQGARNWLSDASFRGRFHNALARAFAIDPNGPLSERNSLLGIASRAVGAPALWTLAEWEEQGIDDLVPVRLTEAEAEAMRQRLELRAAPRIVVPIAGVFALVPHEHVFGDQAAARKAAGRSPVPLAVVPFEDGFVLIPERFSGEAA